MKIFKKKLKEPSVESAGENGSWKLDRTPTTISTQSYLGSFDRTVKQSLKKLGGDRDEEN